MRSATALEPKLPTTPNTFRTIQTQNLRVEGEKGAGEGAGEDQNEREIGKGGGL